MGLKKRISSSTFDSARSIYDPPQPDPSRYTIRRCEQIGKNVVLEIKYDGVTTFEGCKILVFYNTTLADILITNRNRIDPHFAPLHEQTISPTARFIPTAYGWSLAKKFAENLE